MTTMSDNELVRQQSFECDGPVDIDIELASGVIEVRFADDHATTGPTGGFQTDAPRDTDTPRDDEFGDLGDLGDVSDFGSDLGDDLGNDFRDPVDEGDGRAAHGDDASHDDAGHDGGPETDRSDSGATEGAATGTTGGESIRVVGEQPMIVVEVRAASRENSGLSGLLNWVGGQFGAQLGSQLSSQFGGQFGSGDLAEQAVRETLIEVRGNRLSVHAPKSMPLRRVALSILVHAPAGSSLNANSGSADIGVSGTAGDVRVNTGSGDISVERAAGHAKVKTGSGDLRLGAMKDGLSARSGSGGIEVSTLTGDGALHSGSGDVWLGSVMGDKVTVRTGSGDLTVADAAHGSLQLTTGSGDLRIGIRQGVTAEIDVSSGSGRTRSDLTVSDIPPTGDTVLHLRARTGSGEAVVSTATA